MTSGAGKAADGEDGLTVERVASPGDLDAFIRVPWPLYENDPNWVPPLIFERKQHLNRKVNPFFRVAEVEMWVARRAGLPVGRISAQVNRAHLERYGDDTGHFGLLEATDEPKVFEALFSTAENWLRERGMKRVRGPFSLSINDEAGLLIDGFDTPPYMMMGHAPPYYGPRVEAQGYAKAKDLIAYHYYADTPVPRGVEGMVRRVKRTDSVVLRQLNKRRYHEDLGVIMDIFNDAWANNWGFVPFSEVEIRHLANEMKPLVSENLVCIAELDGRPVAMAVTLPNLNEAIRDLDGRLLPFGWAKLLWRLKFSGVRSARMALMGVRRELQGTPMGAALAFAVVETVRRAPHGCTEGELSWILEDNLPMRHMIETFGARAYKTYRVYGKDLA